MRMFRSLTSGVAALVTLAMFMPGASAQNLMDIEITEPGQSAVTRSITLSLNKSTIIDFTRSASDVFITNPEIADAAVQTDRRMVFRGVAVGQTNAYVFDAAGNQMLNLEIRVEPDTSAFDDLLQRHLPNARISTEAVNSNILLTGYVDSLSQSDAVIRMANAFFGVNENAEFGLINMIEIGAKDQVLLQVRVVEMQRSLVKQLGINLNATPQTVNFGPNGVPEGIIQAATSQAFSVAGGPIGGLDVAGAFSSRSGSISASLQALERVGLVRTLAEPNITALSGEPANFLAGGEFPVPVAQDEDGISVEFRPFGVGLGFTPIVLSEGRISLRMSTEVSELSSVGAFQGQSSFGIGPDGNLVAISGLTIPALTVRRAETTIELPSGQSMMIAGLIESSTRQTLDQVPGIKDIPVLGALFRSRDFVNEETELVIIVTPYLVDPAAPSELVTPDSGFANAGDAKTFLFGKLNRMYGANEEPVDTEGYTAPVGFIEE